MDVLNKSNQKSNAITNFVSDVMKHNEQQLLEFSTDNDHNKYVKVTNYTQLFQECVPIFSQNETIIVKVTLQCICAVNLGRLQADIGNNNAQFKHQNIMDYGQQYYCVVNIYTCTKSRR